MEDGCDRDTEASGEGLWLIEDEGTAGLTYTHVIYTDSTGLCDETTYFTYENAPTVTVHPASDPDGTGAIRVFLTSQGEDCGVREVEFDLGQEESADWSNPLETGTSGECDMSDSVLSGTATDPDGRWLLAFGGDITGTTGSSGGICAFDLDTSPYTEELAVDPDDVPFSLPSVAADPHVANVFYFLNVASDAYEGADAPGVYWLERRLAITGGLPGSATAVWSWHQLASDDLEHREPLDVEWGADAETSEAAGADPLTMTQLYVATAGGGPWVGTLTW